MTLDADLYLNLIRGGAAKLSQNRQEINDLNVFPIPDGDTGDNMYMTIEAGTSASGNSLADAADSAARGMLLGARGNSGVILSRIFAGISKGFASLKEADAEQFAAAMQCGVKEAYGAVSQPVEGTILTVLREGVEAAKGSSTLEEYFDRWIAGMEVSLEKTPELLDVLKKAGVVDSGGAGLLCIAEGMCDALHGIVPDQADAPSAQAQKIDFGAFTEDSVLEFGYCTEFLLRLQNSKEDVASFDETIIRDYLSGVGDSLVFFREGSIIKVHVHTMDPGAVLSKCRQWGEFLTIKVENMTLQHHENHMDQRFKRSRKSVGVVAVASGNGLRSIFQEMGADCVIEGGQTMNPSVERFIEAFDSVNAETIIVLPNNGNIILSAKQAADVYDKARIVVIETRTLGEGYYALANLDTSLSVEEIAQTMGQAASSVRTGLVSRAVRDSGAYHKGEWLGFSGKEILCGSTDRSQTLESLAEIMEAGDADILVLFSGEGVSGEEGAHMKQKLEKKYPMTEVILLEGGQPVYDYILMLC